LLTLKPRVKNGTTLQRRSLYATNVLIVNSRDTGAALV
jgi:hypothetical protein